MCNCAALKNSLSKPHNVHLHSAFQKELSMNLTRGVVTHVTQRYASSRRRFFNWLTPHLDPVASRISITFVTLAKLLNQTLLVLIPLLVSRPLQLPLLGAWRVQLRVKQQLPLSAIAFEYGLNILATIRAFGFWLTRHSCIRTFFQVPYDSSI
jgi:hypothetical protein